MGNVKTYKVAGVAAGVNLNPKGTFPAMFEPVHESAPDIAGNGLLHQWFLK